MELGHSVEEERLRFLLDFCYLPYLRTDIAARRMELQQTAMADLIFERDQAVPDGVILSKEQIVRESLKIFTETRTVISDLKIYVFRNKTTLPFITSDDPAIQMNRFYTQRLGAKAGSAGIGNAGLLLMLPLTPEHLFCGYDGDVYTIPGKHGMMAELTKTRDALALNVPQFLKASQNLYFHDWNKGKQVRAEFENFSHRWPEKWHKLHYAVRDDAGSSSETHTRYRVVHTAAERTDASEGLIHFERAMLDPGLWCSAIKFRDKLRYIDTASGAGYLRRSSRSRSF